MNIIKKVLAAAVVSVACSGAMASSVTLESGGSYSVFDPIPPGWMEINVGSGVTGAIFRLEDTINDGYTVAYQLYESDKVTTVGAGWTFTDLGLTAVNLAQAGVYRALNSGSQYFLKLAFTNGDATSWAASTNISAVPLPAAAWLFGSALLGLGALRRKQKAGANSEMALS